jgi:iron complex transport system permease protein
MMIEVAPTKPRSRAMISRDVRALLGAAVVLVFVAWLASTNGTLDIPISTTLEAVWKGITGRAAQLEGLEAIVWNLRLPRVIFGALVGATLAAAGAAMQGLFRNPLADPYLMGTASGAAFGATVAIFATGTQALAFATGMFASTSSLVPLCAFLGAFGAVMLTLWLSSMGRKSNSSLVLSGVIVGAMLTAITTYIQMRDADRMRAVFSWTLGNLALAGWSEVLAVLPYALLGMAALWAFSRSLDALQLGEDTASTLGIRVDRIKLFVVIAASLATAAAVSYAGIIGFVGLIAPHVMRRLGGPAHRTLIPSSALAGAALLVLADLGARVLIRPQELPVGIVTTMLGGPFFLWLLRRKP